MDVFVARQPIFDRESRVHAYELLYRSNGESNEFTGTDEDRPTLEVISGSLLTIGLHSIAAGKKAFINFGRNLLVDDLVSMLPKESVVIEVLETVQPDAEVVRSCRKLRDLGYTIALDDFEGHPRFEQLASIAHILKIDMRQTSRAEQERLVSIYQPRGVAMLAEKVETREEFEWASNAGYDFFQGYFFARPAIISAKELQPVIVTCLRLLQQLQNPELDFKKMEELISKDLALTYKLFRYVNSVLFARLGTIQSVRRALAHMGEDGIRRWATVATLPRLAQGKPEELVVCALVRARLSENLARLAGDSDFAAAYLVGLFSLLDALLDRPLQEALMEVGLEPRINEVLLGTTQLDGTLAKIHTLVRAYEAGKWDEASECARRLGLSDSEVSRAYVEATEWTTQILTGWHVSESVDPAPVAKAVSKPTQSAASRKERRGGKRDPISGSLTVMWGGSSHEENVAPANLVEVSAFGAKFRLPVRIPPGSWLSFNHHKIGISGRGTVRHCRLIKGMYEIGVEFAAGTGWAAASHRSDLRNLRAAIDHPQAEQDLPAASVPPSVNPR
jgi:c-di-GMP-related signal transduction protein